MPQPQGTTSRADLLAAALEQSEAGTLAEVPDAPAIETDDSANALAVARDERGRFAPKTEAGAPAPQADPQADATAQSLVAQAAPMAAPPQPEATTRKPPSSWSKDQWARWERLGADPELAELQAYIEKREGDYAKGVSTYKAQWDQAAPVVQAMAPFMPELQQHGIQPAQWIQNLGNAHRALALGSPEQKLQMFAKLATEYGVPLQGLQTQQPQQEGQTAQQFQPDPQFGHLLNTVTQQQRQLQALQSTWEQQQQAHMQQQIDQFASSVDPDLFEAAKPLMGQLLGNGLAEDLKTAYEKALRLDDSLWSQKLAKDQAQQAEADRAAKAEQLQRQQAVAANKKAAAVSPKSASPTGAAMNGGGKKDRRALLEEAWGDQSGHV